MAVPGKLPSPTSKGIRRIEGERTPARVPTPAKKSRTAHGRFDTRRLTVLVLADQETLVPGTSRFWDDQAEKHVVNALRLIAKKVVVKPFTNITDLLEFVKATTPDIVFNLTEHVDNNRSMDGHICALLDLLGVPYTGTGPKGLILCRDKAVSKLIAAKEGFRIPRYLVVQPGTRSLPDSIPFPLVVKPQFGDASEGISQASYVRTKDALLRRIDLLGRREPGAVICEEFIRGREMYVGVLGNRLLPVREFILGRNTVRAPRLATFRLKHDPAHRRRWRARTDFADITPEQQAGVDRLVRKTFAALNMNDYARFDLKLAPSGEWVFLEANPNPGLGPYRPSQPGIWMTVDYEELIREILAGALRRHKRSTSRS